MGRYGLDLHLGSEDAVEFGRAGLVVLNHPVRSQPGIGGDLHFRPINFPSHATIYPGEWPDLGLLPAARHGRRREQGHGVHRRWEGGRRKILGGRAGERRHTGNREKR